MRVQDMVLWISVFALVFLPLALVVMGQRLSKSHGSAGGQESETDGLRFARRFASGASASLILLLLLGFLPEHTRESLPAVFFVSIPVAGAVAGFCGLGLYLLDGRGAERWAGSLASVIAVGFLILLMLVGGAAA